MQPFSGNRGPFDLEAIARQYLAAMSVLGESQGKGRYSNTHKTWDTSRKAASVFRNFDRTQASPFGIDLTLGNKREMVKRLENVATLSAWYGRFAQGCRTCMQANMRPNLGVSTRLWVKLLEFCLKKAQSASSEDWECAKWIMAGSYFAIGYVLGLRGPEGFMLEIKSMTKNQELHGGLVWYPLVGNLKGLDQSPGVHFMRSVPITNSGINVKHWRDLLIGLHLSAGRAEGPAFCDNDGRLMNYLTMNLMLWEALEGIYDTDSHLFPKVVDEPEKIKDLIGIDRTMRRTSNSRATSVRVAIEDREVVERWSERMQQSQGQRTRQPLRLYYTEHEELNDNFRRYTQAL